MNPPTTILKVWAVFVSLLKLDTLVAGSKDPISIAKLSGLAFLLDGVYRLAVLIGVSGSVNVYVRLERRDRVWEVFEWFFSWVSLFKLKNEKFQ